MKTLALALGILFPSLASADSTVLAATATAHSMSAAGVALAANGHWFAAGIPRNGSDTREE